MRKEETITPFLIGIAYAFIRCLGRSSTQTSVVLSVSFGNLLYDTSRIQEAFFALFPVIEGYISSSVIARITISAVREEVLPGSLRNALTSL